MEEISTAVCLSVMGTIGTIQGILSALMGIPTVFFIIFKTDSISTLSVTLESLN